MHTTARISAVTFFLAVNAFLGGCASTPSSQTAQASKAQTTSHDNVATKAAMAPKDGVWYKANTDDGREFWWYTTTTVGLKPIRYTLIAGALASLPSSSPGNDGIPAPEQTSQSPNPIDIEFCPANTPKKDETHIIHNGFLAAIVEPSLETETEAARRMRMIPWPIIIRTPARPAGTFAGTFVLLAIQEPAGKLLRESVFRPNQGKVESCEDRARQSGDDSTRRVFVECTADTNTFELYLNEVAEVTTIENKTLQQPMKQPSPEAAFLVDACKFVENARKVISQAENPDKAPVRNCP